MPQAAFSDLATTFGSDNVGKLASAYESALLHLTQGSLTRIIDRELRLGIVTCLIDEARAGRFDPDGLRQRAISVAQGWPRCGGR